MLTFGMRVFGRDGFLGLLSGLVSDPRELRARELLVTLGLFHLDEDTRALDARTIASMDKDVLRIDLTQWERSASFSYSQGNPVAIASPAVVLSPNTRVRATDGNIGRLKGFDLDTDHQGILKLLIGKGWLIERQHQIPASWVEAFEPAQIRLNRSKSEIQRRNTDAAIPLRSTG